jgi:formate dehydrogenase iron-sulfur subunit
MPKGFFTDTTVCIGCKACEVACKQWNQLPDDGMFFSGMSYDNSIQLGASTWRHVAFVERPVALSGQVNGNFSWLMLSDVCKHCARAGCLEACPTGSIIRTEFDTVYVQPDVCNGCGYCVVACPFGVIDRRPDDGRAFKCTFCYDRQKDGLTPACAKVCPTESIKFGPIEELQATARDRMAELQARGVDDATLYDGKGGSVDGVHTLFIVRGDPRAYNLPLDPEVPTVLNRPAWQSAAVTAGAILAGTAFAFFAHRGQHGAPAAAGQQPAA